MTLSPLLFGAFGLGGMEILLILAVVLLLFGAKKLPELAKGLGKSIKEFKKASNEAEEEDDKPVAAATSAEAKKVEPVRTHGPN
ncbi:MAG: twin-arginine translocase TatA/TatE family subunit [Opitutaceae bacterium]|nr:twin-arginine translocase TatA/TatE family subunit [Opitutaceae bacterium]